MRYGPLWAANAAWFGWPSDAPAGASWPSCWAAETRPACSSWDHLAPALPLPHPLFHRPLAGVPAGLTRPRVCRWAKPIPAWWKPSMVNWDIAAVYWCNALTRSANAMQVTTTESKLPLTSIIRKSPYTNPLPNCFSAMMPGMKK